MNPVLRGHVPLLVGSILLLGSCAPSFADESEVPQQLTLADLTAYRAALAGFSLAGDSAAPVPVSFKQLWSRPGTFHGRRVTVQGRIERIFRQGPVGSFPALAEIWIASPAGDPFCLVVPQENTKAFPPMNDHGLEIHARSKQIPAIGRTVHFTGTFLKMVRYAGGDSTRVAPLIVGNQPPLPAQKTPQGNGSGQPDHEPKTWAGFPTSWILALTVAVIAAGVLGWRHFRVVSERAGPQRHHGGTKASMSADPPLKFIEPQNEPF